MHDKMEDWEKSEIWKTNSPVIVKSISKHLFAIENNSPYFQRHAHDSSDPLNLKN